MFYNRLTISLYLSGNIKGGEKGEFKLNRRKIMTIVDLHCHTSISDNSMATHEVIHLAKQKGITHLAITDHDTTKGLEEASIIGKEVGIEIIPGIEISAFDFKRNVRAHILGYYIQPNQAAIEGLCHPFIEARHENSKQMVQKIIEAGYEITWEQVCQYADTGTGVYKQHIMHALIEAGYTDEIYSPLYKTLFSRRTQDGHQGKAYIPLQYIDVLDAIRVIKEAGGVPVIAHPGQFNNYDAIPEWVNYGLEGIEVYHPDHTTQDEEHCKQLAAAYNLVQTGGSDFHGEYGPTELGSENPGLESVEALKRKRESAHSY